MFLRGVRRRIQRTLEVRGILGTATHGLKKVLDGILRLRPSRRRQLDRERRNDERFDREYGVDTGGLITSSSLDVRSENWKHSSAYVPVEPMDFEEVLADRGLDYSRFVFVDFGSGKGRALLIASRVPFKKVIGVEFSAMLNEIARQNLQRYRGPRRCQEVEVVEADAALFELPAEPAVLFFYHPFDAVVMSRVVANVGRSVAAHPRPLYVIYVTPTHADLWDRAGFVREVRSAPAYKLYEGA